MCAKKKNAYKGYDPRPFETTSKSTYTRIYDDMLMSDAFRSLGNPARFVYLLLKSEYKGNYTGNTVTCPYSTMKPYGMNTKTIKRALLELEEKGFIEIEYGTRQFDGNLRRDRNKYTFSDKWKEYKRDTS